MQKKVFVKKKGPVLVRLYNFFLFFFGKINFVKYEVNHIRFLKTFYKETGKKTNK